MFGEQLTDRVVNTESTGTASAMVEVMAQNGSFKEEASKQVSSSLWSGTTEVEGDKHAFDPYENDLYTLLRLNCKLFVLESDKINWAERGYGVLKVIDSNDGTNCKISKFCTVVYCLVKLKP